MPTIIKSGAPKAVRGDRVQSVKKQIFLMRGQRVRLDHDLAQLYGVTTKRLNPPFTRNRRRFPNSTDNDRSEGDFVFKVAKCNLEERAEHQIKTRNEIQ